MLERVILFSVHSAIHVAFYTIPRALFALFVRLPRTLWDLITFHRPFTYSFKRERHIKVVRAGSEKGEEMMARFGLNDEMYYSGPMYNGHIHTVLGTARLPRRVQYERELVEAHADANPICLDWHKVPSGEKTKGIILLIPGLGNYGQTNYIQRFARLSVRRGYHCCVLTPRGMGSAPLTCPNITCVSFTADIRQIMREVLNKESVLERFGAQLPVLAMGYSCGANTIVKAVAEECDDFKRDPSIYKGGFPLIGLVSVMGPNEMTYSASLLRTRMGKILYVGPIMTALRKYLKKHRKMFEAAREGLSEKEIAQLPLIHRDFDAAFKKINIPRDIDEHVVAAHFKYKDEFEYYRDADSPQFVEKISIPTLIVVTRDDPIAGFYFKVDYWQKVCDENVNSVYVEMPTGGHFGFVQDPFREFNQVFGYLQSFPIEAMDKLVDSYAK